MIQDKPVFIWNNKDNGNWFKRINGQLYWLHLSPIATTWLKAKESDSTGPIMDEKWDDSIQNKFNNFK